MSVNPNLLIVEGDDDKFSVAELMGAHVPWPQDKNLAPVWIEIGKSVGEILKDGYLSATLKRSGVRTVGVMLDADDKPAGRYGSIRGQCAGMFPNLPAQLPAAGLIIDNADSDDPKRFGAWIMPDNSSEGSLETFLRYLIPDGSEPLWKHATESVDAARAMGAGCRDSHIGKANLYTWLAWQDPPGQSPGRALTKKILNPCSPSAASFVAWFRNLYGL
ncbi:MAG TPA: DUF3226 domain-containing protein [Blastocatellia bacterium]|nr:DUF3226 domain-containing protein [Blastocatellia bacterium]